MLGISIYSIAFTGFVPEVGARKGGEYVAELAGRGYGREAGSPTGAPAGTPAGTDPDPYARPRLAI